MGDTSKNLVFPGRVINCCGRVIALAACANHDFYAVPAL
jgi:hypothetical protein